MRGLLLGPLFALGALSCRATAPAAIPPPAESAPPPLEAPPSAESSRAKAPQGSPVSLTGSVGASPLAAKIDELAAGLVPAVIEYRRDLHQHPELGNREHRTATVIAAHLEKHGWTVRREVAHTGLVAVLEGGKPGPVVALRAEMDALPVKEQVDVPFASTQTASWRGEQAPVMHACGHDLHMAIVMGVAELLPQLREELPGTVKLLFQPAEEGAPPGEEGGAELMVAEGALSNPTPEAIFGLHVVTEPVGDVLYRSGPAMASSDRMTIVVKGRQTHGAYPWKGVDPITVSAQIVLAMQTIVSRQLDVTKTASVVSVGSIHGGVRSNIIPDEVELVGTIRTFDADVRDQIHRQIEQTATHLAAAAGAEATVTIERGYPVVINDPALLDAMLPTLRRVAGAEHLRERSMVLGAEDFAYYQQEIPGVFFFLGIVPPTTPVGEAPSNHSPKFFADEGALQIGVRAMSHLAVDYLFGAAK
ncbi:MAG: amidohydrolase [Myxococcota bacterium]